MFTQKNDTQNLKVVVSCAFQQSIWKRPSLEIYLKNSDLSNFLSAIWEFLCISRFKINNITYE